MAEQFVIAGTAELGSRDSTGVAMVVRCGISVVAEKTGREARLARGPLRLMGDEYRFSNIINMAV